MAKRYIIYTLSDCSFCDSARKMLIDNKDEFYEFLLDDDPEFLSEVKSFYKHKTVPIVVENDTETGETTFVGGSGELDIRRYANKYNESRERSLKC